MARRQAQNRELLAVILVTRSRPGPNLVFHYPPNPRAQPAAGSEASHGGSNPGDDIGTGGNSGNTGSGISGTHQYSRTWLEKETQATTEHNGRANSILGISEETLPKLLSPGCWSDRKKFEICVNGLTFVGHPMYAAQDGSWSRKHSHSNENARSEQRSTTPTPVSRADSHSEAPETSLGITITEPRSPARSKQDFTHVPESLDSRTGAQSLAASMNSGSSVSTAIMPEQLTMFHVVFAVAESKSSSSGQAALEIYQHVAKKLSKAIHYCQNQNQYLGTESKKILNAKAKARQEQPDDAKAISDRVIESSELAWALKEVYEQVSIGEVAGIRLDGTPMSLQIPPKRSAREELSQHSGLLLLEDKDILLRELAQPDASPLAYFIRDHTPTKSLQKHATNLGMPMEDILALARHLVKWRKARVITPLHQRNTYIVGRQAPLDRLESHYIADYGQRFPVLPSLPQILKVLSGKPIKYGMLVPSRDHRSAYMDILAYLVQHNFVEQLKTYGWLQAPMSTMRRVPPLEGEVNENRRPLSVASLLSPQIRPVIDDDTISVSSERTIIPISVADRRSISNERPLSPLASSKHNATEKLTIITNPHDLTSEDTSRLQHIRECVRDRELSERLPSLLDHFDGESAFEAIAACEGLKRSKVEAWLEILQEAEFLMSFRSA